MKTSLLLNDERSPAKLMLPNIAPTKMTPRETEAVVGSNCDRWGHPCPGCGHRDVELKVERPFSLPLDE
jgi:hypothetical protein